MSLIDKLTSIAQQATAELASATTLDELEHIRVVVMGKKGTLAAVLRSMGTVDPAERPLVGKKANEVRTEFEALLGQRKADLQQQALQARMKAEAVDVTLPGTPHTLGTQHLISQIVEEIEEFFVGLGYSVQDGPYVETTYYNFTALNAPEDHPSRSPRDTFYLRDRTQGTAAATTAGPASAGNYPARVQGESDILLRTQTSGVQIHTMEEQKPPIYMICPGTVFRPDTADANHLPQFTQIEGLVVDEGITFGDLKGTLDHFCRAMFGADRATRYRPHFFPFTEPSCEVDVSCNICHGSGCRFCKNTGWLEILGCGMVDPNVFGYVDIDPEKYSGFAFGIGAERVAALRYDLPDLRMLITGDMRFLQQF